VLLLVKLVLLTEEGYRMTEEFLNPDGLRKRQQLIEHILRLLGMSERGGSEVLGAAATSVDLDRFCEPQREVPCRPISTQSLQPMRVRCDESGISFAGGQVTWIGIPV